MDERKAQRLLTDFFMKKKGTTLCLTNVKYPWYESDFIAIAKNQQVQEVEIKVSKWDYLRDVSKVEKHENLANAYDHTRVPNCFYYALPSKIIQKGGIDLPSYAGLIALHSDSVKIIKVAPLIHSSDIVDWKAVAIKLFWDKQRRQK